MGQLECQTTFELKPSGRVRVVKRDKDSYIDVSCIPGIDFHHTTEFMAVMRKAIKLLAKIRLQHP